MILDRNKYYKEYYHKNKKRVLSYIKKYQTSEKGSKKMKEYQRKYSLIPKNIERAYKNNKLWNQKNKEKRVKISKRWRENNPEKYYAHKLMNKKGIKIPKNEKCNKCKINLAKIRHHPDYSKPLKVKFLCKKCHFKEMKKYKAHYY